MPNTIIVTPATTISQYSKSNASSLSNRNRCDILNVFGDELAYQFKGYTAPDYPVLVFKLRGRLGNQSDQQENISDKLQCPRCWLVVIVWMNCNHIANLKYINELTMQICN